MGASITGRRKAYIIMMRVLMGLSIGLVCALVAFLIGYVLWKGIPNITWELLTTKGRTMSKVVMTM